MGAIPKSVNCPGHLQRAAYSAIMFHLPLVFSDNNKIFFVCTVVPGHSYFRLNLCIIFQFLESLITWYLLSRLRPCGPDRGGLSWAWQPGATVSHSQESWDLHTAARPSATVTVKLTITLQLTHP